MTRSRAAGARALVCVLLAGATWTACDGHLDFATASSSGSGGAGGSGATLPPGTCTVETDCHLASLHCDLTEGGVCVACINDQHCATAGLPICDSTLHRCVECQGQVGCAPTQTCVSGRCLTTCAGTAPTTCAAGTMCEDGLCTACSDDDDRGCTSSPATPFCLASPKICAACRSDADCPDATKTRCDPVAHACVSCTASSQCPLATPACDPSSGTCVAG